MNKCRTQKLTQVLLNTALNVSYKSPSATNNNSRAKRYQTSFMSRVFSNSFRMGSQIQYSVFIAIWYYTAPSISFLFSSWFHFIQFCFHSNSVEKWSFPLLAHIYRQERYDNTWNILCVLFFFIVGVSPCVWISRGRMQSADANFVICLDWAVADGASGRLRHRCFRAGWGAHERQALSPCGQRVSTRMWWSKTSGMRKGGGGGKRKASWNSHRPRMINWVW